MIFVSEKGQALVESLLAIKLGLLALALLCFVLYLGYARMVLETQLHEAMVCCVTEKKSRWCEKDKKQRIDRLLIWGRLNNLNLNMDHGVILGHLKWSILPEGFSVATVEIEKKIFFP